ncbi:embryo defective 1381 [Perilla frutescens var. hirtella]|uniref:Embryo defective 1381 n=1 Tax=Perilla frutescens var. hirtella TaxID=608512 RepID=A0AAD4J9E4_PERFH|nr:embryo defective 1381 [Perilla frutescens var. hirtella]
MVNGKPWRIIPRPLLETVLNNHVQHHRVPQPLVLHGPRGVGKTTLILERLFEKWNTGPHVTGYVDFGESVKDYHPKHGQSYPWISWTMCPQPKLVTLKAQLENCLESMAQRAIKLGTISSHQIFTTLMKWHSPTTALNQILNVNPVSKMRAVNKKNRVSTSNLWDTAVFKFSVALSERELDGVFDKSLSVEESSYYKEAMAALKLAKEVIRVQGSWRENAIQDLNNKGGFSRSLAHSATDWPCLLLELLSLAAEVDHFQPKLVLNNIELLKNAVLENDRTICGSTYHDSLIWRVIALGANERCLPVVFVTSDSYYSYRAFIDFGFPDIFISRETFGWTPAEAKLHMVGDYFSQSEWEVIIEVLGSNPRHLFEVYALKLSNYYQKEMYDESTFEDIMDLYLAYLQVNVVNPAMDKALLLLEKFAADAQSGKIPEDRLQIGAPWRHPPKTDIALWTKIQLMDFVQSLVNAGFAVNYFADWSLEFFEDPAADALLEVGLLYTQRDPSFIRPVSRGIQRCLVRWQRGGNSSSIDSEHSSVIKLQIARNVGADQA